MIKKGRPRGILSVSRHILEGDLLQYWRLSTIITSIFVDSDIRVVSTAMTYITLKRIAVFYDLKLVAVFYDVS